ncbi:MAG: hypothetical protein MK171_00320 [Pirellulales bacterium]|nr:hypothetical protein [Pirellulales bacterium]
MVGCGSQGGSHINGFNSLANQNVEIAYVCDPDEKRRTTAAGKAGDAKPIGDLRKILDDKSRSRSPEA